MEKNIWIGDLLAVYGKLLPEKQRNLIDLTCNEDLSLSEISEVEGITRQGVHDSVKRGENQLELFESTLHMIENRLKLEQKLSQTESLLKEVLALTETDPAAAKEKVHQAIAVIAGLLQKEE